MKQASRSWNLRFDESVKGFGFVKYEDEPCVYKKISGSATVFLVLYVDDILLIGNDIPTLQNVKSWLGKCFSMKDLGEAAYILGIKIYRDRSKRLIGLSQSTYIDKVLKRFSMQDSKRGYLPMSHGISLRKSQCPNTKDEREWMSKIPYASAIAVWIKKFITDLEVVPRITNPFDVYCDNNGAIAQAKEPRSHQRSKHILKSYHLIQEIIERGDVKICRVPTYDNVADLLTKPLPKQSMIVMLGS